MPTGWHTESTQHALAGTATKRTAHQYPDLTQAIGLLCVRH
jgi:hypothetical protein